MPRRSLNTQTSRRTRIRIHHRPQTMYCLRKMRKTMCQTRTRHTKPNHSRRPMPKLQPMLNYGTMPRKRNPKGKNLMKIPYQKLILIPILAIIHLIQTATAQPIPLTNQFPPEMNINNIQGTIDNDCIQNHQPTTTSYLGKPYDQYQKPTLPTYPIHRTIKQHTHSVIILFIILLIASIIFKTGKGRLILKLLLLFSLIYFGFIRKGCLCSIGSIGKVAQALTPADLSKTKAQIPDSYEKTTTNGQTQYSIDNFFPFVLPENFPKDKKYISKKELLPLLQKQLEEDKPTNPKMIALFTILFFFIPIFIAFLFGRIFCSSVCPMGAVQELLAIKSIKIPQKIDKILKYSKIAILITVITFAINSVQQKVNDYNNKIKYLTEGYEEYTLIKDKSIPTKQNNNQTDNQEETDTKPLITPRNCGQFICRYDPFVTLFRLESASTRTWLWTAIAIILSIIFYRPFCRYLCPYAVILGIIAKISLMGRKIIISDCIHCKKCSKVCPVDCITIPNKPKKGEPIKQKPNINTMECIACGKCLEACPKNAIK